LIGVEFGLSIRIEKKRKKYERKEKGRLRLGYLSRPPFSPEWS